ncbi:MAG TPA: hypothetical protein EYG92_09260, partial [Lutibacter sp.]|nr:hypothetical protein [Lutibacter sp.]
MKQIFLIIVMISFNLSAQFSSSSPWMLELKKNKNKTEFTFQEISDAFNSYWLTHDKNKKGSGYKPFKRFQERWKSSLDQNGYLVNHTWDYWQTNNRTRTSSSSSSSSSLLVPSLASNWQSIGPTTVTPKQGQGRINTIIVDPNNPNTYYVGAPSGGLWKSTNAGASWTPLTDYLYQIGVSGIAIDPNDSNTIYISTGDDDNYNTLSIGVLKSTNGGITWSNPSSDFTGNITNEIYINPNNSNMIWVATNTGVYRSIDAGLNWVNILSDNIIDLKIKPNNPSVIYAVSKDKFYKSTDEGDTFSQITSGLPATSSRFAIDITPSNNDIVYLLSANLDNSFQGVYKSTNSGNSFTQTLETDDIFGGSTQAWYDFAITVSDTDQNTVFVGVLDIWKSTNGGNDFTQINEWYNINGPAYTHADIHFLRYFNGDLFCGSDGGIYKSTDNGINFSGLNDGLAISQFYRIANEEQSATKIVGGLQDNGGFTLNNGTWYYYHSGDGMDCAVDPNTPGTYYGFSQNGGWLNITTDAGITLNYSVVNPSGIQGNWITPLVINSQSELFAGYDKLYKLINNNWQAITTSAFNFNIDCLEINPNNNDIIFASSKRELYKSTNSGVTFSLIYTAPHNITSIEVNNDNSDFIYLTANEGWYNGKVLKSTDGGDHFTDITANIPLFEQKLIIKHYPLSTNNDLFLGTSLGVYHMDDTMTSWEPFDTNLPNVPIFDLEINTIEKKLIVGTYGRSSWVSSVDVLLSNDFITTWKTDNIGTSNNTSITIPTYSGETYSYDVDWENDGAYDDFGITGDITHNYGTTGEYIIKIKGQFPRMYFNNNGDKEKIITINHWGDQTWSSMENAFFGCSNLELN